MNGSCAYCTSPSSIGCLTHHILHPCKPEVRYTFSQSTYLDHLVFSFKKIFCLPVVLNWHKFSCTSSLQGHLAISRTILVVMMEGGVYATDT